jgi:hypothetical protein
VPTVDPQVKGAMWSRNGVLVFSNG